jgi:drug/metabolite transporter (DMT)-like permease
MLGDDAMGLDAAILGFAAAGAWGISDVSATVVSRRIGSRATTGLIVPISCVLLVSVFVLAGGAPPADLRSLAGSMLLGLGGASLYFLAYAAFRAGPITIVGPILSASGGLTVLLSIIFLNERPSPLSLVCAVVATLGVVLAGVVIGGTTRVRLSGPGIAYALVALVIASAITIVASLLVREESWLTALTFARITNAAIVLAVLLILRWRRRVTAQQADGLRPKLTRQTTGLVLLISTLEIVAVACFFAGIAIGPTWLVGLTSSFGPLVVVAAGLALFRERPAPVQWAGVAMVLASAIVLSVRP